MPKQGWKWRTERFREMPESELKEVLQFARPPWYDQLSDFARSELRALAQGLNDAPHLRREVKKLGSQARKDLKEHKRKRISPRLARWIYENLVPPAVGPGEDGWLDFRRQLLWQISSNQDTAPWTNRFFWREIERQKSNRYGMWVLEAMAGNVGDIRDVPRFIALYEDEHVCPEVRGEALYALAYLSEWRPELDQLTSGVCRHALYNDNLPYARAGACFLAAWTCRFGERIKELQDDDTIAIEGWGQTVGWYAKDAYEGYLGRQLNRSR